MPLSSGSRLGPYEVRALLGAGGMGEVYLAVDTRLHREVAVKVLPDHLASDPGRVERFEREARAAGALAHPNVVTLHDVGTHHGAPYLVTERLEGDTLRARLLHGPVPVRKAVELGAAIARGLSAAHQRGIVHRDLKPENVFLTRDGGVKILDFGVAKLLEPDGTSDAQTVSLTGGWSGIIGTVPYMSPEQVRGDEVDARSDIFALGAVLYEMLSARRPFGGESPPEIQTAILREDPAALPPAVPAAIGRLVAQCLEKQPDDRFDTARDVALALEAVLGSGRDTSAPAIGGADRRRRLGVATLVLALLGAAAVGATLVQWVHPAPAPPLYTQLTFRRGALGRARFSPDGRTLFYAAAWNGEPMRIFATQTGSRESRDLGIQGNVLSVSATGELAVQLGGDYGPTKGGILARGVSLAGGAPRELLDDVLLADWDADGHELAVVHRVNGRVRLEYPIGRVLYEPPGSISAMRVLPSGAIAVFERSPEEGPGRVSVALIQRDGTRRILSPGWADWGPLSWSTTTGEIWFSAGSGGDLAVHAVDLRGRVRLVERIPGDAYLQDVGPNGRLLLARSSGRGGVVARLSGDTQERDASWLDFSYAVDLSSDGRQLLLTDLGGGLSGLTGIALRAQGNPDPIVLGKGDALALAPDGRTLLAVSRDVSLDGRLTVLPVSAGSRRELEHPALQHVYEAAWFPDGARLALVAGPAATRARLFTWATTAGAEPRPLSAEGTFGRPVVSADGTVIAVAQGGMAPVLFTSGEGTARAIPGAQPGDEPLRFSLDGRVLFVRKAGDLPAQVDRVELATGSRTAWRSFQPADLAGVFGISSVVLAPDGQSYAYTFSSALGTLYLVEGVR